MSKVCLVVVCSIACLLGACGTLKYTATMEQGERMKSRITYEKTLVDFRSLWER